MCHRGKLWGKSWINIFFSTISQLTSLAIPFAGLSHLKNWVCKCKPQTNTPHLGFQYMTVSSLSFDDGKCIWRIIPSGLSTDQTPSVFLLRPCKDRECKYWGVQISFVLISLKRYPPSVVVNTYCWMKKSHSTIKRGQIHSTNLERDSCWCNRVYQCGLPHTCISGVTNVVWPNTSNLVNPSLRLG